MIVHKGKRLVMMVDTRTYVCHTRSRIALLLEDAREDVSSEEVARMDVVNRVVETDGREGRVGRATKGIGEIKFDLDRVGDLDTRTDREERESAEVAEKAKAVREAMM